VRHLGAGFIAQRRPPVYVADRVLQPFMIDRHRMKVAQVIGNQDATLGHVENFLVNNANPLR
jgi:hypothetical protein